MQEEILAIFPERIRRMLEQSGVSEDALQEIRIRCGQNVVLIVSGKKQVCDPSDAPVDWREFGEIIQHISNYSLYAFEEEIRKGYLTIPGGHRIGLAGRVVMENNRVRTMKNLSFLNVRVSHERKGCADALFPGLVEGDRFLSTLIVSPPGGGKTTLLRDIVRKLASGDRVFLPRTVSVVDERSEIAGCYKGIPQKDVGIHCDVLDACGKQEGIRMMLRSMAPEVIAVDEIGTEKDCDALNTALTSGCALLATAHGNSLEQLRRNFAMKQMLSAGMFERIVLMNTGVPGQIRGVYDAGGQVVIS